MDIESTESQPQALAAEQGVPRAIDPRTNAQYLLIPVEGFEAVREVGPRNAIGRMEEESGSGRRDPLR